MELFAQTRREARVEGLSTRELARRYGVGRPTVRQALLVAEPPPRKPRIRSAPRLEPFKSATDAMLVEGLTAPRKQRHTAGRVFAWLADEYSAVELSYSNGPRLCQDPWGRDRRRGGPSAGRRRDCSRGRR